MGEIGLVLNQLQKITMAQFPTNTRFLPLSRAQNGLHGTLETLEVVKLVALSNAN